jgi:uroporphyrinogen-III synthase
VILNLSILSTKKLKSEVIELALEDGISIIEHDFINVKFNVDDWPVLHDTLVFTSANAVRAFQKKNWGNKVYQAWCLNGETLETLMAATNVSVQGTAENALSLAKKIYADRTIDELSFICSRQRRDELPGYLAERGVVVQEVTAYETIANPVEIEDNFSAVLFFSPSAVQSFFQKNKMADDVIAFCIGHTTAAALASNPGSSPAHAGNAGTIAILPTQEAMIETVKKYYEYNNA